jgi:hypothetical protein
LRTTLITAGSILVVVAVLAAGCSKGTAPSGGGETKEAAMVTVVNSVCPIMNTAIDRTQVPASLVVDFEGQKVGFCCGQCPSQWQRLSEDQKRAKLAAALGNGAQPATGQE